MVHDRTSETHEHSGAPWEESVGMVTVGIMTIGKVMGP